MYESTFDQVLAYCRRRSLSSEDAEGAAVETYLTAWRKIDEAVAADSARVWLFAVAFRVSAKQRHGRDRFRRLVGRLTEIPLRSAVDSAEDMALTTESSDGVHVALATLAPIDQELVKLAALEGLSHEDIASS